MVIDWERHLALGRFAENVKKEQSHGDSQLRLAQRFPIEVQLKDMDEAGIDRAVLTEFGPTEDLKDCRAFNDEIANWVKVYPERFIGFAHVPPLGGEETGGVAQDGIPA